MIAVNICIDLEYLNNVYYIYFLNKPKLFFKIEKR